MGFGAFGSIIVLTFLFEHLACQQPNTDDSFVSEFLKNMSSASSSSSSQAFNLSASVCSWPGVSCDANKEVVELIVSGMGLSGPIPDNTIGKLNKLQILDLSNNTITALPSDFWSLGSLKVLNLSSNQISGSLASNFGNFGLLEAFDLSSNRFSGEIPETISSLVSLKILKLDKNKFEHNIPSGILQCQSLVSIDLSLNQLNGTLPQGFGAAFPKLESLNLAGNNLHGTSLRVRFLRFASQKFPQIESLSRLEYLNLSKANLHGHIPAEISKLSNLSSLDISLNNLFGKIPFLRSENLQILDLSYNNLSGEIPQTVLEKLPSMEKYNFSYNNLTLCSLGINPNILQTAFYGSSDNCPIAANPKLFKRTKERKGMELALALTLSMVCLLSGLLFLAFGCRRKTKSWAMKQTSYKEEQNISGPFSFQTDSTTWVADVKQANSVPVVIFEKPLLNITFADLLYSTSNFDRVTDREAAKELEYLGRIKHPNLVPLTGYCFAGDQRIAIYDYMENGNLQNFLHDLPLGVQRTDDWSTDTWEEGDDMNGIQNASSEGLLSLSSWRFRHKIALGTARALAFIHHGCSPPIIHRDVKASSVYLDYNLEPRLSDFGLAKIFGSSLDEEIARSSPSYVPPEFCQPECDIPTPKSDVYCYGVVLFELITGKKPVGDDYPEEKEGTLVSWVRALVRKNLASRAIDPKISDNGIDDLIEEALKIGYLCTADLPSKRPSMQQIVGLLKDIEPPAAGEKS
ncbi:hypothetical protein K1719_011817 [Acacia pycnantha]|nr:hypothetical protein K1719_011817 [Acacia pycnantha]